LARRSVVAIISDANFFLQVRMLLDECVDLATRFHSDVFRDPQVICRYVIAQPNVDNNSFGGGDETSTYSHGE